MSDPYAPRPQDPNQPYSGQPYSGQPSYYPQQGPAQPDPYAQQPYGQPQQGYPQPGYGQQFPVGYPPQPPVKKRRTGLIIGLVVAVLAVIACSGIAVVAIVASRDKNDAQGTGSDKPVTLAAPQTIGTLTKGADQSQAKTLNSAMSNAGFDNPFAAVYQDTKNEARRVVIWGGTGEIFKAGNAQQQLNGFFSAMSGQLKGSKPTPVDPGALGGKAACAKSGLSGIKVSVCAWSGTGALLGFIFNGLEPEAAGAQMLTILPSIVTR